MDERLEKALEFANYRSTLYNQQEYLKLKLNEKLLHSFGGGTFRITPELISFIGLRLSYGNSCVMLDVNQTPVMVDDLKTFYDDIFSKYEEATNQYYTEVEKLKKARSVKKSVDW